MTPGAQVPPVPPPSGGAEFVGKFGVEFRLGQDLVNVIDAATRRLGSDGIRQALLPIFNLEAGKIAGKISNSIRTGKAGLFVRTGVLYKSIVGRGELIDGSPAMRVGIFSGPALAYAGVQEHGTQGKNPLSPYPTIKPKKGKALAIPVGPALTGSGVPRFVSARQYRSPRGGGSQLKFVPVNRGRLIGVLVDEGIEAAREQAQRKKALEKRKEANPNAIQTPGVLSENAFGDGGFDRPEVREQTDGAVAYILLRAVDIKPKRYLLNGFLEELPAFAARLGTKLAGMVVPRKGSP